MSLWRNDCRQPLAAIHGASHCAVADIAWSPDCSRLLFAAGDTVVAAQLEPRELGGVAETPLQLARARETVGQGAAKRRLSMKLPAGNPAPVPAPVPQPLPQRKRETETHETPVSRRRKKQVAETPVEPAETPVEKAPFPAMSLTLPATLPFPAGDRVLTMQSLPLTTSPAGDDESVTLLQATSPAGTLLWSWLGQGVPALAAISPRVITVASRGGLLHLLSSEGQTLLPPPTACPARRPRRPLFPAGRPCRRADHRRAFHRVGVVPRDSAARGGHGRALAGGDDSRGSVPQLGDPGGGKRTVVAGAGRLALSRNAPARPVALRASTFPAVRGVSGEHESDAGGSGGGGAVGGRFVPFPRADAGARAVRALSRRLRGNPRRAGRSAAAAGARCADARDDRVRRRGETGGV